MKSIVSRWKFVLVAMLVMVPIILMVGVGAYAIWKDGYWIWLAWVLPISWAAAWVLLRFSKPLETPLPQIGSQIHWTPKDRAAMEIIEREQKRVVEYTGQQLVDPQFYTAQTVRLATEFARHYHPRATDPLESVSVVELLAAVQLVAEDLETMLRENVPGSHLITVSQWRMLANAPAWWRNASNLGWLVSVVVNPANIARFAVSKAFADPLSQQLQTNMLGTFYVMFARQLGYYLIELNSGRLRGGSARYREVMRQMKPEASETSAESVPDMAKKAVTVTIAVIGQVKAGKSSLVNCLIGEQHAAVDVLPLTRSVQRYDLQMEDRTNRLVLLDTPGYSDSGATAEQTNETREAVRNADLVLLVADARSPAKQADVSVLDDLANWFQSQHRLKPPSIITVVSKIDGLSPVMEWAPPYSMEKAVRPKELSIRAALDFARSTFGNRVASVVPACTERSRVFGIEEYVLPTVSLYLDEARAVSLVRAIHREYDSKRVWQVVSQLMSAGSKLREMVPQFAKSQLESAAQQFMTSASKKRD